MSKYNFSANQVAFFNYDGPTALKISTYNSSLTEVQGLNATGSLVVSYRPTAPRPALQTFVPGSNYIVIRPKSAFAIETQGTPPPVPNEILIKGSTVGRPNIIIWPYETTPIALYKNNIKVVYSTNKTGTMLVSYLPNSKAVSFNTFEKGKGYIINAFRDFAITDPNFVATPTPTPTRTPLVAGTATPTPIPSNTPTSTPTATADFSIPGLVGNSFGAGRVAMFTNTMGFEDLANNPYAKLVSNVSRWLAKGRGTYNIHIVPAGNVAYDTRLVSVLKEGVPSITTTINSKTVSDFDGNTLPTDTNVLVLVANYNWERAGYSPLSTSAQQAIVDWVGSGGGLLVSEWVGWSVACNPTKYSQDFKDLLPVIPTNIIRNSVYLTYNIDTVDGIINSGVPDRFSWTATNISGVESNITQVKPGSIVFYRSVGASATTISSLTTRLPITPTPTNTPTNTATPTGTPTQTPTRTPLIAGTTTPTPTPTNTPTNSPTFPVGTPTPTATSPIAVLPEPIKINIMVESELMTQQGFKDLANNSWLKTTLMPLFNYSQAAYDANVSVFSTVEKVFPALTKDIASPTSRVINIHFAKQALSKYYYEPFVPTNVRLASYEADLINLRTKINLVTTGKISLMSVAVGIDTRGENYYQFITSVDGGLGNYSGSMGLSDKPQFDIARAYDNEPANYYADIINVGLTKLGYAVQPTPTPTRTPTRTPTSTPLIAGTPTPTPTPLPPIKVNVMIDSSMSSTLKTTLMALQGNATLNSSLVNLYGGNATLLNQNVAITQNSSGVRPLQSLKNSITVSNQVVNVLFVENCSPLYYSLPFKPTNDPTTEFKLDMSSLKESLASIDESYAYARLIVIPVGTDTNAENCYQFFANLAVGSSMYGPFNLKDKPDYKVYRALNGRDSNYYAGIVNAAVSNLPTPTPTNTPTNTSTPTNTPTNTSTPTRTATPQLTAPAFGRTVQITSGSTASGGGVTLMGATNDRIEFNEVPITNYTNVVDIQVYYNGAYLNRITTYGEYITANGPLKITRANGTSYTTTFGAGTVIDSTTRRFDFTTPATTPTPTPTPTAAPAFGRTVQITSGSTASGGGVTLMGATNDKIEFNEVQVTNYTNVIDIQVYYTGAYLNRITTYGEYITANGPLKITRANGTSYTTTFGAGTVIDSTTRRFNF